MKLRHIAGLSCADLKHDWLVSLCMVTSLVAVIAPLLLLFGLKHGVVSALQAQLLSDPRNLEVRMLSSGSYDDAWLETLARRPEAGFVVGLTRSLNTQADLFVSGSQFVDGAEIVPTGQGDPILAGMDVSGLEGRAVVLSAQAAKKLQIGPGDAVRMKVARRLDGQDQHGILVVTVYAVLAAEAYPRPAGFVRLALLQDMEWYRDGYAVPGLAKDEADGQPITGAKRRYAKARVYARDIESVQALEAVLNGQRIETASRLADIRNVKAIDHLLSTVFGVIAGTSIFGCLMSLVGAFLANVRRKRREIATLRLIGMNGAAITTYIVIQALALTAIAFLIGIGVYAAVSRVFNQLLGSSVDTGGFAAQVTPAHVMAAFSLTLAVAILASLWGAMSARRIQPAESLREI